MKDRFLRRTVGAKPDTVRLPASVSVSAAVFFALYGVPNAASAQQQTGTQDSQPDTLQEIIVTANRREQRLEDVPYNLSAISAEQLSNTGVTDLSSLASHVPGLNIYDFGARLISATNFNIRGINATAAPVGGAFRSFEQSPVGIYIGNSPINGYFQLDDVQRVEILRGPQGTLYGAGSLGGTLRIIPNAPELNTYSGNIEVGGGTVAHSSGTSYTTSAMFNVPVGDTVAFRVSGKYAYDPGFVNVYGILDRPGSPVSGIPALANPGNPVTSSGIFSGKDAWNNQKTFTGRAAMLWKPADNFNTNLAFTYSHVNGDGGPTTNDAFLGGPYPIDPRITFPAGGDYQEFAATDEPYSRTTELTSLDLSYDAGFATLSSTSSYYSTRGSSVYDITYQLADLPTFVGYYAGNPVNPRFVNPNVFLDSTDTFSQEVRLVSVTSPESRIDYVVGLFYENQTSKGAEYDSNPGSPEYSVAQGCTAPYYYNYSTGSSASFPNCLAISGPGDVHFQQSDTQHFTDKSEFGELTWHFTPTGRITFGGRHFEQGFTDVQSILSPTFAEIVPPIPHSAPASKNTWKVNPSYEYAEGHHVYAIWSQGFRRGGANALPTNGPFKENPALFSYAPDTDNNYEVGIKGQLADRLNYTVDVFDVEWDKPQVAGTTPLGNYAVWNANKASSKGLEFEISGSLPLSGLSAALSATYADAKFTEDYSYGDYNFLGKLVPGEITGSAGQQLPGSAKTSATATLNYSRNIVSGYRLNMVANETYRSGEVLSTFSSLYSTSPRRISGMALTNLSVSVAHDRWRLGAYVTNLTDKRVVLDPPFDDPGIYKNLPNDETINHPREIALRLGYSF